MADLDFNSVFELDEDTGSLFWKAPPKNHAEKLGAEAGFLNVGKGKNKSYWHVRAFGRTFKRSRVIFHMIHGRWPTPLVDHKNGNSLDDRPSNLREGTYSQNSANSRNKIRSYELPRGVYSTRQGKFMAKLTVSGQSRSLGVYGTPEEASSVYLLARKDAYHEFA